MPTTVPKYCDRINFMFIIFGKPIPMEMEFDVLSTIKSPFSSSAKIRNALARANSVVGRIERTFNAKFLPITEERMIARVRLHIETFFKGAEVALFGELHDIKSIWWLIFYAMRDFNKTLENIDQKFLPNYGVVSRQELELKKLEDFFKFVIAVGHKLMGNEYKPIIKQLLGLEKAVSAVNTLTLKRRSTP